IRSSPSRARKGCHERVAGQPARELAAGVASHPVRYHCEHPLPVPCGSGRPDREGVLLIVSLTGRRSGGASAAPCHAAPSSVAESKSAPQQATKRKVVLPMRKRSPALSSVGASTGLPPSRTRFDLPPCCR